MENIIETDNLSKVYAGRAVVENINLSVRRGEVFALLGRNGAGKTTTIRMLINLVRQTSGTARILGFEVGGSEQHQISRRIAAITETPAFFEHLSAASNLQTFAGYAGLHLSRKQICELLARCGLERSAAQTVAGFSLGMKQRLGLAVTLLSDPEVIFLDEPTNGLDPPGIVEMRVLLRQLAESEKRTIFLSSHLLDEVEQTCDSLAVIEKGVVVLEGALSDVLRTNVTSSPENYLWLTARQKERLLPLIAAQYPLLNCQKVSIASDNGMSFDDLQIKSNEDLITLKIRFDEKFTASEIPRFVKTLCAEGIEIYEVRGAGAAKGKKKLADVFAEVTAEK